MMDGFAPGDLMIAAGWALKQWVLVYIYSDNAANSKGFGAFAPNQGQ